MKKFFLLLLVMVPVLGFSQDMILMKSGAQVKCKIESETDSTIVITEQIGGDTYKKELRKSYVQGVYKGYSDGTVQRTPSAYLKRAGNFQTASIAVAGVFGGIGAAVGGNTGTIVAAGGGLLALIFHIAGNAQLNYAGRALERIKIENGGVIISL